MALDHEEIGNTFDQIVYEVTDDLVNDYQRSLGLVMSEGSAVPSTLASVYTYGIISQLSSKKGAVLVGQRFSFYRCPQIGEKLLTDASITARYEKRSRQYMEITTRTAGADGSLVCDGKITRILPPEN